MLIAIKKRLAADDIDSADNYFDDYLGYLDSLYNSLSEDDKAFIDGIVADFISGLLEMEVQQMKANNDSFFFRHFSLGMHLRNHYDLWNSEALGGVHPDDVSALIVKRIYEKI